MNRGGREEWREGGREGGREECYLNSRFIGNCVEENVTRPRRQTRMMMSMK